MKRNEAENILNNGFTHPVKDPLWQNILFTQSLKDLVLLRDVQKLSRIKQNGPAYHIYPGAVHTRLSHSLGVYHLGREILLSLSRKSNDLPFTEYGIMSFLSACLLHDIGHFPYAHSLKELAIREHEEIACDMILNHSDLYSALEKAGAWPEMTALIINKDVESSDRETLLYRTILSGTLDPDKLDYLSRDGFFSGIPYGKQDTDFVISSLFLVDGTLMLKKEAVSSVEQILFSKYMMYRTLYWHKGVRSATAMIKKALCRALLDGTIEYDDLYALDDAEFVTLCMSHISETKALTLVDDVEHNNLLERKAVREYIEGGWIEEKVKKSEEKEALESEIYSVLKKHYPSLKEWEVVIDIPEPINFESHIPVVDERGRVTDICDGDMVFTGEVSTLFQKKLRKVALYLPVYVKKDEAERVFGKY